jgi:guanylate kinase
VQGAHKVRQKIRDALLIFVVPPSLEELQARLLGRSTESAADLERRLRDAEYELSRASDYDHVVVNETDQIDVTAERIDAIIAAEHARHPDRRIVV